MSRPIDISDLNKADVFAALYNAIRPLRYGFVQAAYGPLVMDRAFAEELLELGQDGTTDYPPGTSTANPLSFDYVFGRPMKLDFSGDALDFEAYNEYHGEYHGQTVLHRLRESGSVETPTGNTFLDGTMTKEERRLYQIGQQRRIS